MWQFIRNVITTPRPQQAPTLTHPEEPINPQARAESVSIPAVVSAWLEQWKVPAQYRDWWREQIVITIDPTFPSAGTWSQDGKRYMKVNPGYLNPGVVAHEQAHNSYALLSDEQKVSFETAWQAVQGDPMVELMRTQHPYADQTDAQGRHVEGHAEIYRYVGEAMPESLRRYYPKLV